MKRVGNLYESIADMENLREAFLRASRHKNQKLEVKNFRMALDYNLMSLHNKIVSGTYMFGKYQYFRIFDPKERVICAASFEERVVQHAMMRILHAILDNYQINNSYACRLGKGTYKALERAMSYTRKYKWFVKLDVKKYFDSIDHDILYKQILRLIKDKVVLKLMFQLIESYSVEPGKGIPIGNLSSQYFANHYLSVVDHYILEQVNAHAYVRYMDDILIFGKSSEEVKYYSSLLRKYVEDNLKLNLHFPVINRTYFGVPFLGYVVYPYYLRLSQRSKKRYKKKIENMEYMLHRGTISETECLQRFCSMYSFVQKANAKSFNQCIFS